jgi:hypothetical protein
MNECFMTYDNFAALLGGFVFGFVLLILFLEIR